MDWRAPLSIDEALISCVTVQLMYWLERLGQEAERAGGEVVVLNGNHEYLNIAGRFRYATAVCAVSVYLWGLSF